MDPEAKWNPRLRGYYLIPDESKRDDPVHRNEKILIVNIYANRDYSKLSDVTEPLKRMRAVVAEAAKEFPEFEVSITGRPALEADEMATSDHDTRVAEIMGLSLVFVALWIFLRHLWLVIVSELCLGVGIGWTFGWATLSTGRLNLLSLVFVIALIGIGMDYLIQIVTRYRHEKKRYSRPEAIWSRVFRYVSPPISTACLGAAGAFFVSKLTNFAGAGELGVIAGGGLLLCLLAGYTLLPALLTIFPAHVGKVSEGGRYTKEASRVGWGADVGAGGVGVGGGGGLWVALPPKFDPDLIKLQAQGLDSVKLVHKLPTWYAAVMSDDLEKLRGARTALTPRADEAAGTTIRNTDSILDAQEKQEWLAANNGELKTVQWVEPAAADAQDLKHIADALGKLVGEWEKEPDAGDLSALKMEATEIEARLNDPGDVEQKMDRVRRWQKGFVDELHETVNQFVPGALDLAKLPKEVRDHYVSYLSDAATPRNERKGNATTPAVEAKPTYALYAYPRSDLWMTDNLGKFVHELEARVPANAKGERDVTLTGIAVQLFHSTEEIRHAFLMSTIYALLLIALLVFLDLRDLKQTVLAISVLVFGLPMLLLVMWIWRALGEPFGITGSWNFANFFGLPILIGAVHEYGVFMVHRYRETLHDSRRVWGRWDVSDRALLLCATVTSFSFGFLMMAQHRGLASLGWVMAVGSVCIYLATVLVLRPILQWLLQRK